MNKILTMIAIMFVSNVAIADDQFWFFAKTVDSTYHYTRILRCVPTSDPNTNVQFTEADASGPYDEYDVAKEQREISVINAKKAGNTVKLSEGVCSSN